MRRDAVNNAIVVEQVVDMPLDNVTGGVAGGMYNAGDGEAVYADGSVRTLHARLRGPAASVRPVRRCRRRYACLCAGCWGLSEALKWLSLA